MKRFNKLLCFMLVFVTVMVAFCAVSFAADSQYTENLIPKMSSNTSPSGIASASDFYIDSNSSAEPWKAFDKDIKHIQFGPYNTWSSSKTNGWLAYEFSSPQIISKYAIQTSIYNGSIASFPKTWTFEAWDDTNWIILDTRSNVTSWSNGTKKEFTFTNTVPYVKYRINITSNVSGTVNGAVNLLIGELEMMGPVISIPHAPINLIATGGNSKVDLSWGAVEGATSYNIKRSETPGGPYQTIATTTSGAITYTDEDLVNGNTYYYVVSAVNAGGESPNSNEASATPAAPQQTNQLKLVLEVNQEKQLSVSDELSDNTEMDWTSSDPTIATVDSNGKLNALKPGNTVITCTSKDKSYTESINVLVVDLEYQLAVDLNVGGTCRLTIDDLKNTTFVTWTSYDTTIATVSAKGKVTAVSEGLTYVTATDKDGKEIGRIYIRVRQ